METSYKKKDHPIKISQGDILKDLKYIKGIDSDGKPIVINIPVAVVLTQDCDLVNHYEHSKDKTGKINDRALNCILVCPAYVSSQFRLGNHLSSLGIKGSEYKGSTWKYILKNNHKRFHYLSEDSCFSITSFVVDFKHFYTIPFDQIIYNISSNPENYWCSIDDFHREEISQRFANYLSRIALPEKYEEEITNN